MSHIEQLDFFRIVAASNRELAETGRVIEIGSYNVNGTIRSHFPSTDYVGVDLTPGPGVDVVAYGHEVQFADSSFDVALSGECFEHDPYWRDTFLNMNRLVRPGGLVAFTCASRGRLEHGTTRTDPLHSPGTQASGHDYYRNLVPKNFQELELSLTFSEYQFWYQPYNFDLYFAGVRSGAEESTSLPSAHMPEGNAVVSINNITPSKVKMARAPLRLASRVLPPDAYQSVALKYVGLLDALIARQRLRR